MISFSIVIPAFNAEKTLERAIHSVLEQSREAKEIIVVDDGSTDQTFFLAKKFEPFVRVLQLTSNEGVSSARNKAWAMATGDYLAFLDSDDEWHPQKLASLLEILKESPDTDFIGHPFLLSDFDLDSRLKLQKKKIRFLPLLFKNRFQTSCICIRRTVEIRFDPKKKYCEDYDLALKAAFAYNCLEISEPLTKLGRPQLSKGGLSGNHWKMRRGELSTYSSLWKLNKCFLPLIPFLWIFSLIKHLKKKVSLAA